LGTDQTVIGRFNHPLGDATALIVGNGTSKTATSNAFTFDFDVNATALGSFISNGADYAEMFEWKDGNPTEEDRSGMMVTLEGTKIRKATAADNYILGATSSTPAVVANAQGLSWQGKYVKDKFGRTLYEQTDGVKHPKLNPDYDSTLAYVPRNKRKEWVPVGIVGQLVVRDNGTCEADGYCKPGNDGIAIKSDTITKYRVMERIDENTVRIFIN
ncbi:MAG: hypothetical protein FWC89_14020, partial [Defluviitaleaceae bacterium]|nr:hypothetical protein [Defluviitaleaceae bacterium]